MQSISCGDIPPVVDGDVDAPFEAELLLPQADRPTTTARPTIAVGNTRERRTGNPQIEKYRQTTECCTPCAVAYSDFFLPRAFCSFFHARTRVNASRESMSATDRGVGSPKGPAYCSHPAGATPRRLPRIARKILAFSSP